MKKTDRFLTIMVMIFAFTPGLFAVVGNQTTGVPLDGGLLAILAGAGITYFAARKRKKNSL